MPVEDQEFYGNFSHTIDPKGRVTIPVIFRKLLGERFTIGMNSDRDAIALYPRERWKLISQELEKIPDSDRFGMRYVRLIRSNSFLDNELDAQGRVLLPQSLRQKAKLDKNIRFVGMGQHLEIWDESEYSLMSDESSESYFKMMDYVNDRYFNPLKQRRDES